MKIVKIENLAISLNTSVRLKKMGNIFEIRYLERDMHPSIKKVSKTEYVVIATGELKQFNHSKTRGDDKGSVSQSLKRLRDLLNTNIEDPKRCLWVTLTYRENMQDVKRLYHDFRKFNQRLKYHCSKTNLPDYEYIVAMEPQGRGAWHAHVVLIFSEKAPFISNDAIAAIWRQGFTKTTAIKEVDNIGLYLTAYLGNMDLADAFQHGLLRPHDKVKQISVTDKAGKKQDKAIVKGARLRLYPAGFRLYRKSKGIKNPVEQICTEQEALDIVGNAKLTFERTIQLFDNDGGYINTISYRHFNKLSNT